MKKNQIAIIALVAFSVSACGKGSSFKAIRKGNVVITALDNKEKLASENNETAEAAVEAKALAVIMQDSNIQASSQSDLSTLLSQEIQGLTATMSMSTVAGQKDDGRPNQIQKAQLNIKFSSLKSNECTNESKDSEMFTAADAVGKFVKIAGVGRFMCLEAACENAILVIEKTRSVKIAGDSQVARTEIQNGSLSVLMKKDVLNIFRPVKTESKLFATVLDAALGDINCNDSVDQAAQELKEQQATDVQKKTEDAVRKGQIPAQTLEKPKVEVSISDKTRDAGRAAELARQEALKKQTTQSLVDKGQIPAQTLEKQNVSISDKTRDAQRAKLAAAEKARAEAEATRLAAAKKKATQDAINRGQIPAETVLPKEKIAEDSGIAAQRATMERDAAAREEAAKPWYQFW